LHCIEFVVGAENLAANCWAQMSDLLHNPAPFGFSLLLESKAMESLSKK
jgi:hypothetical protein